PPQRLRARAVAVQKCRRVQVVLDGGTDGARAAAGGDGGERIGNLLTAQRSVIGGLEFRRGRIAVDRQLDAGEAAASEPVAVATELVGPMPDVRQIDFGDFHDCFFLYWRVGTGNGASSNGLVSSSVLSFFSTTTILAAFVSTSTLAIS